MGQDPFEPSSDLIVTFSGVEVGCFGNLQPDPWIIEGSFLLTADVGNSWSWTGSGTREISAWLSGGYINILALEAIDHDSFFGNASFSSSGGSVDNGDCGRSVFPVTANGAAEYLYAPSSQLLLLRSLIASPPASTRFENGAAAAGDNCIRFAEVRMPMNILIKKSS